MFLRGLERQRIIALGQQLGTGIEGYTMKEIQEFKDSDIERIYGAIRARDKQCVEARYFFCNNYEMSWIQNMITSWLKPISTWRVAEARGHLDFYFSGQGEWPVKSPGPKVQYTGDLEDYYLNRGVVNWRQAKEQNKLEVYFSGYGLFPKVQDAYRVRSYKNDYDEFVKSLSFEEYLNFLRDHFEHIAPRRQVYSSAVYFYQTAMCQVAEYIEVLKDMIEPIYIPGDGIGIGSYVCSLLGKQYYSSEPSDMGREAVLMGVIKERAKYSKEKAYECASVFFGNCLYEIFLDDAERASALFELRQLRVVVYDERGLTQSWRKLNYDPEVFSNGFSECALWVSDDYRFYPGSSYKVWYSYRDSSDKGKEFFYKYQAFYEHVKSDTVFVPIDTVSESIMTAMTHRRDRRERFKEALLKLISQSNGHCKFRLDGSGRVRGSREVVSKAFVDFTMLQYRYDYPAFVRKMRNDKSYKYLKKRIKNLVYVTMRDVELSPGLEVLHMGTRSFMTELIRGKSGSLKFVEDMPVVVYPRVPIITSKSWEPVKLKDYERADVLESYTQEGMCFVARVKNPYSKQKVNLGSQVSKIVLVDYHKSSGVARYRLASSVVYDNDMENLEVM